MILIQLPINRIAYCITADESIETHLIDKFFPYVSFENQQILRDEPTFCINYSINNLEVLWRNSKYYFNVNSNKDAYIKIIQIIRDHIIYFENMTALHGATIDYKDKRTVFLAQSGTGKSVLSAYLNTKPEFRCCSDDVVYINYLNNVSIANSKYIYLRPSARSVDVLSQELFTNYDEFISRYSIPIKPASEENNKKLDRIVILSRENIDNCYITKCSDAFNALLNNLFFTYQVKQNIRAIAQLVKNIQVEVLHYNDLEKVYMFLKEYL